MSFLTLPAVVKAGRRRIIDVPAGTIAMWSGSIATIPSGWDFCDGGGGRPDLRDRFIQGSNSPGGTGGGENHSHSQINNGSHTHTSASTSWSHSHGRSGTQHSSGMAYNNADRTNSQGVAHTHTLASTGAHTHTVSNETPLPPYYNLAFIQKVA